MDHVSHDGSEARGVPCAQDWIWSERWAATNLEEAKARSRDIGIHLTSKWRDSIRRLQAGESTVDPEGFEPPSKGL